MTTTELSLRLQNQELKNRIANALKYWATGEHPTGETMVAIACMLHDHGTWIDMDPIIARIEE
jgi:hypothetical protein